MTHPEQNRTWSKSNVHRNTCFVCFGKLQRSAPAEICALMLRWVWSNLRSISESVRKSWWRWSGGGGSLWGSVGWGWRCACAQCAEFAECEQESSPQLRRFWQISSGPPPHQACGLSVAHSAEPWELWELWELCERLSPGVLRCWRRYTLAPRWTADSLIIQRAAWTQSDQEIRSCDPRAWRYTM